MGKGKKRRKLMACSVFDFRSERKPLVGGSVKESTGQSSTALSTTTTTTWKKELKFELSNMRAPAPHKFETTVSYVRAMPTTYFSLEAMEKMRIIVDACPEEVSWLGTVDAVEGDFMVTDIFLLEQEVGPAHTEMSTSGLEKLTLQLLQLPNGAELVNKLKFWGHSHVNMGTTPSSTDRETVDLWEKNGHDFMIRAIVNKSPRMQLSVFDFKLSLCFNDSPWEVLAEENPELQKSVLDEMKEKVKPPETSYGGGYTNPSYPHSSNDYWQNGRLYSYPGGKGGVEANSPSKADEEKREALERFHRQGSMHEMTDADYYKEYYGQVHGSDI